MRAFFYPGLATSGETEVIQLPEREAEHLFRTLRAQKGEKVELLDGAGNIAEAVVTGKNLLQITTVKSVPPPKVSIRIYTAVPRGNLLPALLTSLAEVGASAIIPVNFTRSVAKPESPNERWQMRLIEGCKQSRNLFLPTLGKVITPQEMIADASANGCHCFYGAVGGSPDMVSAMPENLALAIGPEGGFTAEETELMRLAGWQGISFSHNVLRLETAAVTGCALLRFFAEKH